MLTRGARYAKAADGRFFCERVEAVKGENIETLPPDLYRFLGHNVEIKSDSPFLSEHMRLMYDRFRIEPGDDSGEGEPRAQTVEIIDHLDAANELVIRTDRCEYRFTQSGSGGQFSCQDRSTLELDLIGFCGARTLLQSAILSAVAETTQKYYLFHAGVVAHRGEAVIFPASPGMGKTTLVFRLVANGYRFLSDEVACIDPERVLVEPFPRKLIARRDSEDMLGAPIPENAAPLPHEAHEWESAFDIEDAIPNSLSGPCTPRYIVFLRGFGDEARLEHLANSNALFELFRYGVNAQADIASRLFKFAGLLDNVRCYNLVVGDPAETAKVVMDLLERDARSSGRLKT